ncbi:MULTISPECIES: phosphate acetyltransferase [unclassified Enterococcus]|uniref:phosphate acetyltransferase n=1 Tax=unclassified Enterococcus TaxID=2608891 RepID=UPI0015544916|nr:MULTISPECIES: phosphate acetyltransferase [unclassified Enterococcus]MBS7576432.1 phosphate acetyltransferase [Enterococcus sp. MMGLQ5-2]MBS7583664.1 phosphate acetyltransferase [Enterococcus sp. MMGLQ5-1]NPD11525.1 phosphate acetyltransferase [Enterococcus sp. MMGLQ5-1]NPD36269.1 phosphate acetyltransferase [Enterococcus sp. MMGLQ5-2]
MELFDSLRFKIVRRGIRIVFPEATDPRVLGAAARLRAEDLVIPVLIGDHDEVVDSIRKRGLQSSAFEIIDPNNYDGLAEMIDSLVERRKGKLSREQAAELVKDGNYFGTMLVYMDKADGLVSGAIHSTAETVRPALQIIKTKPGISRTSGAFLMIRGRDEEKYLFSDCAINVKPGAQELAEIAIASAETARIFDIDPKVAMLSFSTKGSGTSEDVDKVVEATEIAKNLAPDLALDGELQFDAAYAQSVAAIKAPESDVAGAANVFIFPDLQAGNIGYKIAQRLGNFEAIGPILQGLNKPVSDLSRGASEEDVYKLSIITAAQTLNC